jgi:hypothetical protein
MPLNHHYAIFSPKMDRIYFAIHGIFLILTILMALGQIPSVRWDQVTVRFIATIIFFNGLHTILTWFGIFALPEGREWARRNWESNATQFRIRRWLMISILFGLGWYFLAHDVFESVSMEMKLVFSLALFVLSGVHNVGQTKGLALLQTHRLGVRDVNAKWERNILNVLVLVVFLGSARIFMPPVFKQHIPAWWDFAAVFIGCVLVVALIVVTFRFERHIRSKKFWFASTAIYHPLLLISPPAFVFQRALHGVEYLFLSLRIAHNSRVEWRSLHGVVLVALLLLTAATKIVVLRSLVGMDLIQKEYVSSLMAVGLWIEYTHYYLDSVLFRFKDPIVQEVIGPLLRE